MPGIAALAARFTILTAVRVSVTTGARDSEIGPDVWSIDAERMKAERDHNVPLSVEAKAVLKFARAFRTDPEDDRVFPGQRDGHGVSKSDRDGRTRRSNYCFGEGQESMSTMDRRVERLELEAAAKKPTDRRVIRLVAQEDGETIEQAVARWAAEHPGEAAPDEERDLIILRSLVGPNSREEQT